MKRVGHLWECLISFESLLRAAEKARRGKRFRPCVAAFHYDLEHQLWALHEELAAKSYRPGAYRTFHIHEPKKRLISAAPYRDRVVHHALVQVLEPLFERSFIHDSYACRKYKGTHAAVDRCQFFARRYHYVLKADIRKFFPSIDHAILKALLARKVKDPHVLWLAGLLSMAAMRRKKCATGLRETTCSRRPSVAAVCPSAIRPASSSPTSISIRSTTSSRNG
jgi:retron-type reverse transcriptase